MTKYASLETDPCALFRDLANVDIVKANRFVIIKNICKFVGLCAR